MKLTTKGRYAVTAMLDLALNSTQDRPVCLADVSERQGISLSYLEQLFVKLRRRSLVNSIRGPGGGYYLAKLHDDISVADIINAVDERIDAMSCGGNSDCHDGKMCLTHSLWHDLSERIHEFLNEISLGALVDRQKGNAHWSADEVLEEPIKVM
ncbi:MAG: Rrf2 family transcriptional regulator [Pseudomonadota bacterium]